MNAIDIYQAIDAGDLGQLNNCIKKLRRKSRTSLFIYELEAIQAYMKEDFERFKSLLSKIPLNHIASSKLVSFHSTALLRLNEIATLEQIAETLPDKSDFLRLLLQAQIQSKRGEIEPALASLYESLQLNKATNLTAWQLLLILLLRQRRYTELIERAKEALNFFPSDPRIMNNLGNAYFMQGIFDIALFYYRKSISKDSKFPDPYNNAGNAYRQQGNLIEASVYLQKAIELKPDFSEAHNNLGNIFRDQSDFRKALYCYNKAIDLKSDYPEALNNRAVVLKRLGQNKEALSDYSRAIVLLPGYAGAYRNRANLYRDLGQHSEAINDFERARLLDPNLDFIDGETLHARLFVCNWVEFAQRLKAIQQAVEGRKKSVTPFPLIAMTSNGSLQKTASEIYSADRFNRKPLLTALPSGCNSDDESRISIAYYSADFHNHATAYLMAEFFEKHDRSVFEVHGFSFGPASNDEMRQRLVNAFDHFHDVREKTDTEVAALSRELGIDIAVDLKGYTQNSRPGIFVDRCAPIQVSYLGYPGTQGSDVMDYLIADEVIIPPGFEQYYSEKIIRLPCCYQVNDSKRKVSDRVFTRAECGLPEKGFIFCCFNNNYKIIPETFDCWMSILKAVPDSVLWLLKDNELAEQNLRQHAQERGVSPDRLVFAGRLPVAEHLARHRLADLFLDTWPCNAHTTASDALWMGLPVLTLQGQSFAARVAASLLHYLGLSELITTNPKDYTHKAIELAKEGVISPLKARVLQNVKAPQSPFDINHAYQCYEKAITNLVRPSENENSPAKVTALPVWYQHYQASRYQDAQNELLVLVKSQPDDLTLNIALAACYRKLGQLQPCIEVLEPFVTAGARSSDLYNNLGEAYAAKHKFDRAEETYKKGLSIFPSNASILYNLGNLKRAMRDPKQAIQYYQASLEARPGFKSACQNLGTLFYELGDHSHAIKQFEALKSQHPNDATNLANLAECYRAQGKLEQAGNLFEKALELQPSAQAYFNLGHIWARKKNFARSYECYKKAHTLEPSSSLYFSYYYQAIYQTVRWEDLTTAEPTFRKFVSQVRTQQSFLPFHFLGSCEDPKLIQSIAEQFSRGKEAKAITLSGSKALGGKHAEKKRIAFVSPDFNEHAVSYLFMDVLSHYKHDDFIVDCVSLSSKEDAITRAIQQRVDNFFDVSGLSLSDTLLMLRNQNYDVAIDLAGLTQNARAELFYSGIAPIQVNYLGYPCTMGSTVYDYILVDSFVIPKDHEKYYTEKVLRLPGCYQPCSSSWADESVWAARKPLPNSSVVLPRRLVCLNKPLKVTPQVFSVWMRVLKQFPHIELTLYVENSLQQELLLQQALRFGVSEKQISFIGRVTHLEHLKRIPNYDLCLDTYPYGAHTTCSDALRMGVPTLTLVGQTFASRVCGSILSHAGLPEFLSDSIENYETKLQNICQDGFSCDSVTALREGRGNTSDLRGFTERFWRLLKNLQLTNQERTVET